MRRLWVTKAAWKEINNIQQISNGRFPPNNSKTFTWIHTHLPGLFMTLLPLTTFTTFLPTGEVPLSPNLLSHRAAAFGHAPGAKPRVCAVCPVEGVRRGSDPPSPSRQSDLPRLGSAWMGAVEASRRKRRFVEPLNWHRVFSIDYKRRAPVLRSGSWL